MNSVLNKAKKIIFDENYRFLILSNLGFYNHIPDEIYLKKEFKASLNFELNLDNPTTYNEKIQWLKLNDRKPIYTTMVDKYKVREYIKQKIGENYLIPLLGVWDDVNDIEFNNLPEKFVLKCNHNSGLGMFVCTDKSKMQINKVKRDLKKGLKENYYYKHREWPYKNVDPKIICEEFIGENDRTPDDYKFLVINGEIYTILVCKDRDREKVKFYYFDADWNRMYCQRKEPAEEYVIEKPDNYDEMVSIVKKLSEGFSTIRVDLYNVSGKIYFSELTFYDSSGFDTDITYNEDCKRGLLLKLPIQ